jgi:hypothetical protein
LKPGFVARRIEAHLPGIHNRLVSCLDLAANGQAARYSAAFHRRLVAEALERIRGFRPWNVVDFLSLRRAGLLAGGGVMAFLLALALFSDRLPTALARIFQPFADIPPVSGVLYRASAEPADGPVVQQGEFETHILRGEDMVFTVRVERGSPERLLLEMHGADGPEPLRHDLQKQDEAGRLWKCTLSGRLPAGFENGFSYRVLGGGTWSPLARVVLVDRPKIVGLYTVLHYPAYLGDVPPRVGPPQSGDVTGPEGSDVEVVVQAEGDVQEGEVQILKPGTRRVEVKDRSERVWFEDRLPAGAQIEGTWEWDAQTFQRPAHTEPAALGTHGHWFHGATTGFPVQPGEDLFTYVYVVPGHEPEALMLQWHDGDHWEHRAYWGDDKINLGKKDSPSRRALGPLPGAGQWQRLEVPAELVGLAGKVVKGMSFTLSGGQCYWHRAGTIPTRYRDQAILLPEHTFPMEPTNAGQWSGRFPLRATGLYRVELRNELGHANQTMKEAKFVAVPDLPPQIVLEQPGKDISLSEPGKVPLVIAAHDDFGLSELALYLQRGDNSPWARQELKRYAKPRRDENLVTSFDLRALRMEVGDSLRYRAEARDRKGQVAKTAEFVVRIAAASDAADKQLAAFEKTQDPFGKKLADLMAAQSKVNTGVETVAAKYAPVLEKLTVAQIEALKTVAEAGPAKDPARSKDPASVDLPLKLDPETTKLAEALQKELAELAKQEQENVQAAQQFSGDLAKSVEQAKNLDLLPKAVVEQMQAAGQVFDRQALRAMQEMAGRLNLAADAKLRGLTPEQVRLVQQRGGRLQQELAALKQRLDALAAARKQMPNRLNEALAQLLKDMQRQQAGMTARELEELRAYLAKLRAEMKRQTGRQEDLLGDTRKVSDWLLPDLEKQQARLEQGLEKLLGDARDLQAKEKLKRMTKRPLDFPEAPYTPEADERLVRPKEEDPDEPEPKKAAEAKHAKKTPDAEKKAEEKKKDEDEPTFMPQLGGPRPKLDPRFAGRLRPVEKMATKDGAADSDRRDRLEERQEKNLQELDLAEKVLRADEQSLEEMLGQLQQALKEGRSLQGSDKQEDANGEASSRLMEHLLQSPSLRQALTMAARMHQPHSGNRPRGAKPQTAPAQILPQATAAAEGNLVGGNPTGQPLDVELGHLDLAARSVILKMQPKLREELLQGMREEGPEGYRPFIQDYFKRLTEVKSQK